MTIFVALLNERVDVWRPVEAQRVSANLFRLAATEPPPDESWEFPPGAIVRCEWRALSDGEAWVAVSLADSGRLTLRDAD